MEKLKDYASTVQYLYRQLPMFSKMGKDAIKKDLTNTLKLCEALDNPQERVKSIHIAGTNGKGSTSHMLAAALQAAGYKTGLYTSPHLVDFRERFRIDGKLIDEGWVVDFVNTYKDLIEEIQPSFFEITVAMAFQAFAAQEVDIAVIETGLGGRLDSTNIITPLLSVITNISYDHQDILGNTLQEIATEKAGIIKPTVPVLIGEEQEETARVFFEAAMRNNSKIYYAQPVWDLVKTHQTLEHQHFKVIHRAQREMYDIKTDLLGSYQQHNIRTVLATLEILDTTTDFDLPLGKTLEALAQVKQLTGLRGRWEVLQKKPLVIADVGHNPAGMKEVMNQWKGVLAGKKRIVVGFVKDKDVAQALSEFPKDAMYYFCNANIPRAMPAEQLQTLAQIGGLNGTAYHTVKEAVLAAMDTEDEDTAVLITGSFFIVGEAMECFTAKPAGIVP
jgi:dihydrofolate synthase/folylpolyglutamate synthase